MKIAFYLPEFADGGVERTSLIKAKRLVELGHEVDIVSYNVGVGFTGNMPAGVRFIDLKSRRTLTSLPGLARYLRRTAPDAVIAAHYYANVMAVVARELAGRRDTRLILTERTALRTLMSLEPKHISEKHLRAMRLSYHRATAVVANSRASADELAALLRWPAERIKVIYNPTYDPAILDQAREPVDCPWLADTTRPVLVAVGRLTYQKDFATLLTAFRQVRDARACRLIILGKGPDQEILEQLAQDLGIADDVWFAGFTTNPYRYMSRANAFVLSSRYEGLPNVLIEAQALGVPIISTNCATGPDEILLGGRAGRLTPVGDAPALALGILQVLEHPEVAARYVAEGRRQLERFTPEICVAQYLNLLKASHCHDA
jgi:glycosyltransferase involved in cell wall biosynthesis